MKDIKDNILSFNIQVNGDASVFLSKLMSENRWSRSFAELAIDEYKKFLYLLYVSDKRLSPSKVIDTVWHCHLTFTHSYWHELCRDLLGKDIHHVPSSISCRSKELDQQSFQRTLALYERHFGQLENKIWAKPHVKKTNWLALAVGSSLLTACTINEETNASDILLWVLGGYVGYRVIKWLVI